MSQTHIVFIYHRHIKPCYVVETSSLLCHRQIQPCYVMDTSIPVMSQIHLALVRHRHIQSYNVIDTSSPVMSQTRLDMFCYRHIQPCNVIDTSSTFILQTRLVYYVIDNCPVMSQTHLRGIVLVSIFSLTFWNTREVVLYIFLDPELFFQPKNNCVSSFWQQLWVLILA